MLRIINFCYKSDLYGTKWSYINDIVVEIEVKENVVSHDID